MASEIEEVVVHADPLDLEEIAPDRGDGLLHLPHGRHEGSRRRLAAPGCDLGGFPTRLRGEPSEDVGDRRVRLARDEREHGSKVARHGGSLPGRHAIAVHEHLEPQLGRRDDHERDRVVRRIGAEEQLDLERRRRARVRRRRRSSGRRPGCRRAVGGPAARAQTWMSPSESYWWSVMSACRSWSWVASATNVSAGETCARTGTLLTQGPTR